MSDTRPPDPTAAFFDRLVLISNSVPKSGSTLLFSMQQTFLLALCGKSVPDHAPFLKAGVQIDGSYLPKPHSRTFLDLIADPALTGGPFVFKTHTLLNADLRQTFLASDNVFASLSIRDPVEIYFSARDNFRKSGEFPEFAEMTSGLETMTGYFTRIYESSVNASYKKAVPIVRYAQIVTDPIAALLASFHPTIKEQVMHKIAEGYLNLQASVAGASKRMNLGLADRRSVDAGDPDYDRVARALAGTRTTFGYGA